VRKWGYARQKLFEALNVLVGSGRLRLRLTYAADHLAKLKSADFPADSRQTFKDLMALLTKTPLTSTIRYEVREITPREARRASETILSLYLKVSGGL
jgi:hypothetical protein